MVILKSLLASKLGKSVKNLLKGLVFMFLQQKDQINLFQSQFYKNSIKLLNQLIQNYDIYYHKYLLKLFGFIYFTA